jgi:uncharacterized protein
MNPQAVARFIDEIMPAFQTDDAYSAEKDAERSNVANVRAMYQAVSRGDYEGFRSFLAEEVELEFAGPPGMPLAGRWKGRDQVMEGAAHNYAQLEDQRPELRSIVAQGDMVAVVAREQGRIRATGKEYDIPWMHLYTFREGKVIRVYGFCDSQALTEAAQTEP